MADNVSIAADEVSSAYHQRVKVSVGPDGTAVDLGGRNPGDSNGNLIFTEDRPLIVTKSATPTITAGAYSSGDAVGGLITLTNAARYSGGAISVVGATITDLGKQSAALTLMLWDRTFTATADGDPFDPSDADILNLIGKLEFAANDWSAFNDNSAAEWGETTNVRPKPMVLNGTSLFGQLVTYGTPTYTSTSDLTVKLQIQQH